MNYIYYQNNYNAIYLLGLFMILPKKQGLFNEQVKLKI